MIVFLMADGFEELEAVAPADILKRCGGDVKFVSVSDTCEVTGAHGIKLLCDMTIRELDPGTVEMTVLPGGGKGVENLDACPHLTGLLNTCIEKGAFIAAICAAPSLLGKRGILRGRKAVCYPGFEKFLAGAELANAVAVRDGKIITAKAAGAAVDFGLLLAETLYGEESAVKVGKAIYYE